VSDKGDKSERRLRLVRPEDAARDVSSQDAPADALDDAPPSEQELREAEALREAIERGDEPVSSSLRAAYAPRPLEVEDRDALVRLAVEGAPSGGAPARADAAEEERAAAALLRDALARPESASDDDVAQLARAIAAAARPREIEPLRNEALIARALRGRGRRVRDVAALVVGAIALAAGAVLVLRSPDGADVRGPAPIASVAPTAAPDAAMAAVRARSTMDLFDPAEPFARSGGESSRMDKIARSRSADLRTNRFKAWRVPGAEP
jgi:hypothetical protein